MANALSLLKMLQLQLELHKPIALYATERYLVFRLNAARSAVISALAAMD